MFESVFELKPAFDILFQHPDKLTLVTDEMYGETQRQVSDNVDSSAIESVEHLGKYVYQMTNAKIEAMKANGGAMPIRDVNMDDSAEVKNAEEEEEEDRPEDVILPDEAVDRVDKE